MPDPFRDVGGEKRDRPAQPVAAPTEAAMTQIFGGTGATEQAAMTGGVQT